jgi:purine-binding chemotaxis protein CheW
VSRDRTALVEDDLDDLDRDEENVEHLYLTFHVEGEEYAVPVTQVTEIVRLQNIYAVPDVPRYIRGVINLRGKVIALIDVRSRFGLTEAPYTDRTVVVVLEVGETAAGLVVDGVSEVAEIPPDQVEARSEMMSMGAHSMVKGMGKRAARISFILDVAALLDLGEAATVAQGAGADAAR